LEVGVVLEEVLALEEEVLSGIVFLQAEEVTEEII
jgi:hypothetical protein